MKKNNLSEFVKLSELELQEIDGGNAFVVGAVEGALIVGAIGYYG